MKKNIIADLVIGGAELINMSDRLAKNFAKHERGKGELRPDKFKDFITDEWEVDGYRVITVSNADSADTHVIFLHGGGYVTEATAAHRHVIEELVKRHKLKVSFIDYPLAPENKYDRTHEVVMEAYKQITIKNYGDKFCLFGDSAGGGLALALLQRLRDEKVIPFPERTALVSPWVDLSISNPNMKQYEDKDPLITLDGLAVAAGHYIGGGDPSNTLVSPIFGRMDNLGEIFISVGTNEVLKPDCMLLRDKITAAYGSQVTFYEGEKMIHDWILAVPLFPESMKLLDMVGEFYNK